MHEVTQYATNVVYGNIVACKWEKLSCKRHLKDLERQGTEGFPFVFDESRADRIFAWFRVCRHVRGPFSGQPMELDNWQKFDLGSVFGWVHKDTGKRKYKTAYIRIGRGNAKSTEMSGVTNYGMCADALYPPGRPDLAKYEASPEIIIGAVDREQANIVWGDAREMGLASPGILNRLKIQKAAITHKTRGGKIRKLSKDSKNKDGGSPCMIVIDEYHAHPTSLIKDVTASGKGKRSQCLEFIITTAGEDAENSPCFKEDNICKKILEGEIPNESYFVMIREIDDEDDPHDQTCWAKANPMFQNKNDYADELLATVKDEYDLAFGSGDPSKIRQWMIKRVNRFQAGAVNKYFSGCMDKWKELAIPRKEFLDLVKGRECYNGEDLAKCIDLTASGFVFKLDGLTPVKTARGIVYPLYAVCAHGFIPKDTVTKHEHTDRVPYQYWADNGGWCTITPGAVTDDREIKSYIHDMEFDQGWKMKELCCDPYGARQFMNEMGPDGEGYQTVEIRQGFTSLSEPTKKLRDFTLSGEIVHDGSPLLAWCLNNAVELKGEGELIKLSKKHKDDSQRIDLAAAIINALFRALLSEEKPKCPYTEERGILML